MAKNIFRQVAGVLTLLLIAAPAAKAQTFTVDFARPCGSPLVKTKFGVYQTPLVTLPRLLQSVPLLHELGVSDLRYEIGWGKPDVLAFDQIGGTATTPTYDFTSIDRLTGALKAAEVTPLLALTYCPNPLKSREGWPAWQDSPSNLGTWKQICGAYAAHLQRGGSLPRYEVWNEPDMPEPNSKMFFTGGPDEYRTLYQYTVRGVHAEDTDALVGGAATAYDLRYLKAVLPDSIDFASIHAYDNYPSQINAARSLLAVRPEVPIYLTEYASFTDLPANGPQSRAEGAMRFFRDVKGLLNFPDVTKVYWAQWLDAGDAPGMGLVTFDGHRKALFNAFQIYHLMPVDRVAVSPDGAEGINLLASCDDESAGVVLWNETPSERNVTVNLTHLPFAPAEIEVYRVNTHHASYVDDASTERLQASRESFVSSKRRLWTGTVPAQGVVFLRLANPQVAKEARIKPGRLIRTLHWFPDRTSNAYADFDGKTGTARLGMGSRDIATAQVGAVLDHPRTILDVKVTERGPLRKIDANTLLCLRFDFAATNISPARSVLYHGGLYDSRRTAALPWGKGGTVADRVFRAKEWGTRRSFAVNLAYIAPSGWDGKRVLLTFVMQNTGRGTHAKISLSGAARPKGSAH